jgi:hypothetical protein
VAIFDAFAAADGADVPAQRIDFDAQVAADLL